MSEHFPSVTSARSQGRKKNTAEKGEEHVVQTARTLSRQKPPTFPVPGYYAVKFCTGTGPQRAQPLVLGPRGVAGLLYRCAALRAGGQGQALLAIELGHESYSPNRILHQLCRPAEWCLINRHTFACVWEVTDRGLIL